MSNYTIKGELTAHIQFSNPDMADWSVRINTDGTVEVNPKLTIDEGAQAFWDAVMRSYPQYRDAVLRTVPDVDPTDHLFVGYTKNYERRMYCTPGMAEIMGLIDVKEYVRVKKEVEKPINYAMTKNGNPL